jgi:hypothetical protein
MRKHLKKDHPTVKIDGDKDEKEVVSFKTAVPEVFRKKFTQGGYYWHLMRLIVCDYMPFTMVETEAFRAKDEYLRNAIDIPHADTIKNDMVKLFAIMESEFRNMCAAIDTKVSYSEDAWSSYSMDAYLGVMMHFVDSEWKLQTIMADFIVLSDAHTGENLAKYFIKSLTG